MTEIKNVILRIVEKETGKTKENNVNILIASKEELKKYGCSLPLPCLKKKYC